MRHRVSTKTFGRDTNERKALFKSLLMALFEHGSITTTRAKGKAVKSLADKYLHKALVDSVSTRRQLHKVFGRRDVVNTLVDRLAPAFKGRQSGFTSLQVVGVRRGDNTPMVKLSLVDRPEVLHTLKSGKTYEQAEVVTKATAEKAPTEAVKKTTKKVTKPAVKREKKEAK